MNGLFAVEVSWLEEPTAVPEFIRSSSSPGREFLLRPNLHATTARPPSMMAPPTPTTTPIMIFLRARVKPELPDPPLWLSSPAGALVAVADVASVLVVVSVCSTTLPLTVTMLVTTRTEVGLVVLVTTFLVGVGEEDVAMDVS